MYITFKALRLKAKPALGQRVWDTIISYSAKVCTNPIWLNKPEEEENMGPTHGPRSVYWLLMILTDTD